MRGLARPLAEMVEACFAPRMGVKGFRFGFVLRCLALWRVGAIAPSFVSGWQANSSVSICKKIQVQK
jgi:hypothetical protein